MIEKMMVAFGQGRAVILAFSGKIIEGEAMNVGLADFVDEIGEGDKDGSIEVWEGTLKYDCTPASPNGPEEWDGPFFGGGIWRAPTQGEVALLITGQPVWPYVGLMASPPVE